MTIYDIFFLLFSLVYLPYLVIKGSSHRDFWQRFGILPEALRKTGTSRPIWVHAVSVGEVLAVKNFLEEMRARFPEEKIVLSTTTKTGNDIAGKALGDEVLKFYFPLDFSFIVKRVIELVNPRILIIMETELWPNLILELSKRKIPVALINGRISDRSFRGYRRIRLFFKDVLKRVSLFLMRSEKDAENIKRLGAQESNVRVTGNMKFDIGTKSGHLSPAAATTTPRAMFTPKADILLEQALDGMLLIAGSTHRPEEEIITDAYSCLIEEFQDLRLLMAPRHCDRAGTIKKMIEGKGFETVLLSQALNGDTSRFFKKIGMCPHYPILILDTLGELSRLYRLATIVFMGGSLVKRGGHNIAEPAVFGKPIVFGPYMFNFRDMAKSFLENKAAIKVKDGKELLETLKVLLKDPDKRGSLGRNAKGLIDASSGATRRNILELEKFL